MAAKKFNVPKKIPLRKRKARKKRINKTGMPPGTLIYQGTEPGRKLTIHTMSYEESSLDEDQSSSIEKCLSLRKADRKTWFNVVGLSDVQSIEKLGESFGIHRLVLEDILNTEHSPKVEVYEGYLFFTLKMISLAEDKSVESEQVSMILGENYVISFQEREGDVFEPVRERLRAKKGKIRLRGADYLLYALVDVIADNYFTVIDTYGDILDELEDEIFNDPREEHLQIIQQTKRDLIKLRKSVFPLRESVMFLERNDSALVGTETTPFFRDVYDHILHVTDSIENFRELNTGLKDIYLSSLSIKMNEVMKTLTIIATIFIPLTFVAGVYGMNFENMPELGWKYGYLAVWIVMLLITVLMVIYFRRKKWF